MTLQHEQTTISKTQHNINLESLTLLYFRLHVKQQRLKNSTTRSVIASCAQEQIIENLKSSNTVGRFILAIFSTC